MKKIIVFLVILTIITTLVTSYNNKGLETHLFFRGHKEVARELEEIIDIFTLKKAISFIDNLPVE